MNVMISNLIITVDRIKMSHDVIKAAVIKALLVFFLLILLDGIDAYSF